MIESKIDEKIQVIPFDSQSESIYGQKEHVFIGISPFNSYFTLERITKLINWGMNNFKNITVFTPDTLSAFTLQGKGYSKEHAMRKTKKEDSRIKSRIFKAFEIIGVSNIFSENKILPFTQISKCPKYLKTYEDCLKHFETDTVLRSGCLEISKTIISDTENAANEEQLTLAVQYFLHELPLFINAPFILDVPSSLFVYHAPPTFFNHLYQGRTLVSPDQGFLKVVVT